jgi:hypothetical protein
MRTCLPLLDLRCTFKGSSPICISYLIFLCSAYFTKTYQMIIGLNLLGPKYTASTINVISSFSHNHQPFIS